MEDQFCVKTVQHPRILFERDAKGFVRIHSRPNVTIRSGDYISDALVEIYADSVECARDEFYVFAHGVSTLKYFLPGFNPKQSYLKSQYIQLIKPVYYFFLRKFGLRSDFKNLLIFDNKGEDLQKLKFSREVNQYFNIKILSWWSWAEAIAISQLSLRRIDKVFDRLMDRSYVLFCPIMEESLELNFNYFSSIIAMEDQCIIIVKPHASDHRDYSGLCLQCSGVELVDKDLPLELFLTEKLVKVYTPLTSPLFYCDWSRVVLLNPRSQAVVNHYEREYWPFTCVFGKRYANQLETIAL